MRAGLLKEVIDVYRPTTTTNGLGEQVTTYTKVNSYRARVVHRSHNRENFEGDIHYPNTQSLQLRIYVDIQDNDIIKFQEHYYRLTQAPLRDRDLQCTTLEMEQTLEDITLTPEPEDQTETTEENG